ncbi:MAG TPA: low-specificity L-threonine aldolase [Spirochaetia bacterium]|nr:low-specificity L-threonine aldolase [Spirochaetia bacterium]
MNYIDLRSDTVTWPTEEMREAMAHALVGDDVYGDDPTVNKLETLAAQMLGKEAALFVPSGTFGNQLALFTWCPRGSEIIVGEQCHIIQHEAGAAAVIAGVQTRPIYAPDGIMPLESIEKHIRDNDIHYPPTSLICLENAHSSGKMVPLAYMQEVHELAQRYGLPVHLDGARIFNAAASLNADVKAIAATVDSIMFCLSKGLCAPVGSMLVGTKNFIDSARRKRKIMGGAMRQAGILAAAGIIALETMTKRLHDDHYNARYMAELLSEIPNMEVERDNLDINMVFCRIPEYIESSNLVGFLQSKNILINPPEFGMYRFVTHYWIQKDHIEYFVQVLREYLSKF